MKTFTISLILLVLSCLLGGKLKAQEDIKLISYNVYWGMKQDSTATKEKFSEWFKAQNPDIVALQEVNTFTQAQIQEFAASYGHPYAIIVKEPEPDGGISFPVALTSKYPIINVSRVVDNMIHGLLLAEINGYHFAVTHFHPFSAVKRGNEIDLILSTIESKPKDWQWLLMGDLNSVSPLDKSEYDNGLVLNHIRQDMKKKPHNQNLINNELDYSINEKIIGDGFIDAFKYFHPKFEASAPTKLFYDQSKYPLRYDYVYVSGNMKQKIVSCKIIKDSFTDTYSDHYPVELIFKKIKE